MAKFQDLTGARFGRLQVIDQAGSNSSGVIWNVVCDCGTTKTVEGRALRKGATKSCGCWARDRAATVLAEVKTKHGMVRTGTYQSWLSMRQRCNYAKHAAYHRYGGRGIKICDRWNDFEAFLIDMGERPEGMTLDRIDVDGDYTPENCRWATHKQQVNNRRSNRFIEHDGQVLSVAQWAEKTGLRPEQIIQRLDSGWSVEKTLETPNGGKHWRKAE